VGDVDDFNAVVADEHDLRKGEADNVRSARSTGDGRMAAARKRFQVKQFDTDPTALASRHRDGAVSRRWIAPRDTGDDGGPTFARIALATIAHLPPSPNGPSSPVLSSPVLRTPEPQQDALS